MKKGILFYMLCIMMFVSACGMQEQKKQPSAAKPTAAPVETEEPTASPAPTAPSKTAKKTVKEAFGAWLDEEEIANWRKESFSEEYDDVRFDDVSDWKDEQGNYQFPKGYSSSMTYYDDVVLASRQMPQELLDEISTEELYQLIMDIPVKKETGTDKWRWYNTYETYLQMLSYFYKNYNFIENLINREDAAQVVHQYYQKYTKKEIKKYSKLSRNNYSEGDAEKRKEGNFQLTEGLEWFFLYKEGKEVPDYQVLGYDLMTTW